MKSYLPFSVFGVGAAFLVLSFVWPSIGTVSVGWSEEDAKHFEEVKLERHQLHYQTSGSRGETIHGVRAVTGEQLVEARKRYEVVDKEYNDLQERLNNAKDSPQAWAQIFKWGGITLAVIGVVMIAVQRGED